MIVARETIFATLFGILKAATWNIPTDWPAGTATSFVTTGRVLRHWTDLQPVQQPALFLPQDGQDAIRQNARLPLKWKLSASAWIYVNTGQDIGLVPASLQNNILDAIEALLAPTAPGYLPAGFSALVNKVEAVQISGKVDTDEGTLGPQSVSIVPIEIIVPA